LDFLLIYWRLFIFIGLGLCVGLYYERQNYSYGDLMLRSVLGVLLALVIFFISIKLIHGEISLNLNFEEVIFPKKRAIRRMIHFAITLIGYSFSAIARLIYIFFREWAIWI
jgi:hypothetical protein